MGQALFFDTTAVAERAFGEPEAQLALERLVAKGGSTTATYVREQFKATFVRSIILLHNRVVHRSHGQPDTADGLLNTVAAVGIDLDTYPFAKPREASRARKVLFSLLRSARTVRSLRNTLERLIEAEYDLVFSGTTQSNATECCLCDPTPIKDDTGLYSLPKSCRLNPPRPCKIEDFWATRNSELVAVSQLVGTRNTHVRQAQQAAGRVVRAETKPRGENCTVSLSDAVIAAEASEGSAILTTDVDDFTELTGAMGLNRTVLPVRSRGA
jgi:hypothetical protein